MELRFKAGVQWVSRRGGLVLTPSQAVLVALETASQVWARHGIDELWVTALFDGHHARWSEHWQGNAVDLRTRHFPGGSMGELVHLAALELSGALGPDFRVIVEIDHIHADHRPQKV